MRKPKNPWISFPPSSFYTHVARGQCSVQEITGQEITAGAEGRKMLKSKTEDDFRQRCSEVTIQSDQQGHFGSFVEMIEKANPKFRETFNTVSLRNNKKEILDKEMCKDPPIYKSILF